MPLWLFGDAFVERWPDGVVIAQTQLCALMADLLGCPTTSRWPPLLKAAFMREVH